MSTTAYALQDSATMLRRNLMHALRYPSMSLMLIALPTVFLLLFVYVFGGTLGAGLPGVASGGRAEYLAYVTPGVLLLTIATAATSTAVSVAMDMTEGIVARFRTMAIARVSVLTGHVIGSLVQTLLASAVVLGITVLLGFRPAAGPLEWLGVFGMLALATFATIWVAVAMGLVTKSVETASNLPMPLTLLPFLGSGFVPTDSMPEWLRWFAEYQPFTPIIETVRGLLTGTPVGSSPVIAMIWCVAIALGAYIWAKALYNRDPSQ